MTPELGRSALDALELMNTGVQYLREHVPTDTRIHYAITNSGGNAPGTSTGLCGGALSSAGTTAPPGQGAFQTGKQHSPGGGLGDGNYSGY